MSGAPRPARSVYLDALRAVALVRVIVYHATASWWVTAFTAMPLMFFIAGSLYAASLDRRRATLVIRDRYRRILLPYWAYAAAMVGLWAAIGVLGQLSAVDWVGLAFPVLSPGGPRGPGVGTPLALTWFALWYLQMHLILSAVGPLLRRAQLRRPAWLWAGTAVAFAGFVVVAPPLGIAVFYAACWTLGYHHHDGWLEARLRTTWRPICAVTAPLGFAAFLGFHDRVPVVAGIGVGLLGVFWLALALGARPWIEPLLDGRAVRSVVNWFSQRSLTLYLWHGVALYACLEVPLPGAGSWPGRLAWCAVLLPVAVAAVGWVEDVAARRGVRLWPRLPAVDLTVPARPLGSPAAPATRPGFGEA